MEIRTNSVEETLALGEVIGRLAPANTCLALHGNLGAGKTHLTRGIAVGADVEDVTLVASPTYVLLNIYRESGRAGSKPVFHMDAYRISSEEDFEVVGFDELLSAGGIVVVEWAEKILHLLPEDRVEVAIELGEEEEERVFVFSATGEGSAAFVERVGREWKQS
ncbi:MAG TPA: tRNA (adenosine(37)-N6)-threonylcarbamoyltransferase complex ATPase subunit type 1 TsaE [Phycisphaerae bacterium]|nr:tRNA (adenosine(37)-N6)-threonylcarbamoyltransferase complex ATPase subunit type 1 TsaE [Phycisphaerae bacterium]